MEKIDSITECYRVTGDECFLIRVQLTEIGELEALVNRLSSYGEVKSSLVLSTPIQRMIPIHLGGDA
jgi:Lrp/AsnC family leucine-responsive transcriptional regulator